MKREQRRESGTAKRWKQSRNDFVGTDAFVRPASKASVHAKVVARAMSSRFLGYAFGMTGEMKVRPTCGTQLLL